MNQTLDEQSIVHYLREHPDFFQQHPALLEKMILTHESGEAISLIEKQVDLLRQHNTELKKRLNELFYIARENEHSTRKMHQLILALLECKSIACMGKKLQQEIMMLFDIQAVSLRFFSNDKLNLRTRKNMGLQDHETAASLLKKLVHKRKPVCGHYPQLIEILDEQQTEVIQSMAILPLFVDKNYCFGVVLLGSHDPAHFQPQQGELFLSQLGEIVSLSLGKYI